MLQVDVDRGVAVDAAEGWTRAVCLTWDGWFSLSIRQA